MKKNNKALDKVSKKYNDSLIIRGVISSIPYIGSFIDIVIQDRWNKRKEERIIYFLESLKKEFEEIKDSQINDKFLETEEFEELILSSLVNSSKTRKKEKIEIFAKVVKNAVCSSNFDYDFYEEIEYIIERISVKEFQFLHKLDQWEKEIDKNYFEMTAIAEIREDRYNTGIKGIPKYSSFWDKFKEEVVDELKLQENQLSLLMNVLEQKGLIDIGEFNYESKSRLKPARRSFKGIMKAKLTKIYFELKNYINEDG